MNVLIAVIAALFLLAACGKGAPPQQPATAQPAAPVATVAQPQPERPAAPAPKPDPNAELAARVKKALESASVEIAQGIDVTAANGIVSLFGTVSDRAAFRKAENAAAAVAGVSSVVNRLVVVKGS
jgi:hyperosmotically inducible periplasmic protein